MVLRDINSTLEWARENKIVHRHVDAGSIFLVPGSDRVLLSFVLRPLPLAEMPGAEDDARTIATLARAMLTRSVADPERDRLPLGELRPGLPDRLIEQTDALLHPGTDAKVPDVAEYIATVAMAESLKRAETECAETTRKLLEEERLAREKIEAERQATERAAAEQARLFHLEREEFSRERESILAELQKQRETLERERAALARERAEHQQDRETLLREREEHRRWADEVERAFAAQTAALSRQTRAAQDRVAEERAHIDRIVEERVARELAARLPANDEDITRRAAPAVQAPTRRHRKEAAEEIDVPLSLPPRPRPHRVTPQWIRSLSHVWQDVRARLPRSRDGLWGNRKWRMSARIVAAFLVIVVVTVAVARGRDASGRVARAPVSPEVVTDSAAGRVEARRVASPDPSGLPVDFVSSVRRTREAGIPTDFIAGVRSRIDSGDAPARGTFSRGEDGMVIYTPPARRPSSPSVSTPSQTRATQSVRRDTPSVSQPRSAPSPADAVLPLPAPYIPPIPAPPVRDTTRPDTTTRPRPDTIPESRITPLES
jgi:hypothetical protein